MSHAKKLVLLGSTGSVGKSSVKVAKQLPEEVEVIALAGGSRVEELASQAIDLKVKHVCIYHESKVPQLRSLLPSDVTIYAGEQGLIEIASLAEADIVLVAIVGTAGLKPTLAAIEQKKTLAVASKEIFVMAGEIVMQKAKEHQVSVLPVDSEHNAIFQCLAGGRPESEISRLILTASGGPFRKLPADELKNVTVSDALSHPTWQMGKKISIDSATLFNKGLEIIEARWLFDIPMQKIDVIVHPQSIIHSMVEYIDGSVIAQMNNADMCFPIQYAITWPRRVQGGVEPINFSQLQSLEFQAPRFDDFPALKIAIQAGTDGGSAPAMMNAANEVAVAAFLSNKIKFPSIWATVEQTMESCDDMGSSSIEELIASDQEARRIAEEIVKG